MLSQLLSGNFSISTIIAEILAVLVIIFLVLPFHEWAHAQTAYCLGDRGIKQRGRLSLNPLTHIDPFGALCMLLFGFGWAKPVPVDARYFKNPKVGIWAISPNFLASDPIGVWVRTFLTFYSSVNVQLAVFNLLPIPPLDGSKLLFTFLPDKAVVFLYRYQMIFFAVIFVLLWMGPLARLLSFLSGWVLYGMYNLSALPFGLFGVTTVPFGAIF